jgi:hypothetical protein
MLASVSRWRQAAGRLMDAKPWFAILQPRQCLVEPHHRMKHIAELDGARKCT